MPFSDPQDIRKDLYSVMETLRTPTAPLEPAAQRGLGERLVPIYNYVSAQVEQRNGLNLLYAHSALDARQKERMLQEHAALEQHKAFVEKSFDNAEKHFKTVQLAGYAVFFTVWGFTREWMTPSTGVIAALLMIASASVFVVWELTKASVLASIIRNHATVSASGIEKYLAKRSVHFSTRSRAMSFFSSARLWVWWICVVPATGALALIVGSLVKHFIASITA
ncbi:hypothetical protein WCE55_05030 [Luteimonas sp. MJ293]|uniref:hypothetical protein n=1 Tax=Luteimonas sp. MJ146 TaxID=3129240 RepID=UPI0031BA6C36